MDPEAFRAAAHDVVDRIADYLATIETQPVLPAIEPGSVGPLFPAHAAGASPSPSPTSSPTSTASSIPNATHWQHPGFMAYFATTASGPGMLGEFLTAALGQNPMLWRTSPIGTELETVVVGWLREALGLPDDVRRPAHRHRVDVDADRARGGARGVRARRRRLAGCAGRDDGAPRVYASTEAHSSIEKACMTLGLGRAARGQDPGQRRLRDGRRGAGGGDRDGPPRRAPPVAVVATIGTTSSTSVDPVAVIADIADARGPVAARRRGVRRRRRDHPGAARAVRGLGSRRLDRRQPAQVAVHPARRVAAADAAHGPAARRVQPRARVPAHARPRPRRSSTTTSTSRSSGAACARSSCGCCCAGSGSRGCGDGSTRHLELAAAVRGWVDEDPDWERLAPVPFSTVCFRYRPARWPDARTRATCRDLLDDLNTRLMDAVNRTGEVFLSHTRLRNRFTIRLAVGNLRTSERHVERAWELLRAEAARPGRDEGLTDAREPTMTEPIEILYFYRTRWGAHDEFVEPVPAGTTGRSCASSWPRAGTRTSRCGRRGSTGRDARTGTSWCRSRTGTGRRSRSTATPRSPRGCIPDQETFRREEAAPVRPARGALGRRAGAPRASG